MKNIVMAFAALVVVLGYGNSNALAQTVGTAKLEVTINDYVGTAGTAHYTVAWVTTESGTFVKSLRKQGPGSWTSSQWSSHCGTWNTAKAGSTSLDGYTSATAANYTGTNSPVIQNWNAHDATDTLMPDGNYKFWVQYAEDSGQGPVTTAGLLWTKGPSASTKTYPNQGVNFSNMKVTWTPAAVTVAPTITSVPPPATATVGVPYNYACTATGTAPIAFSATVLPTGLTISSAGLISGTPTTEGSFSGTITATNGTLPNATQAFSIAVNVVPAMFGTVALSGDNLVMSGQGPANGIYSLMVATYAGGTGFGPWTTIATNNFDVAGRFQVTNAISPSVSQSLYRLKVP